VFENIQVFCLFYYIMRTLIAFLCCIMLLQVRAQDTTTAGKWTLQRCVDYAIKNNISVRQADVQARVAALQLKTAEFNKYPSAGFSTGLGGQFGRSVDPTTNQFTTTKLLYQNLQLQGGVQVFGFGQLKNAYSAAKFNEQAALIDIERAANDVSLNVALYYLQVLASREQINIAAIQVGQDNSQLKDTRARVNAGTLPELNAVEIEAQLATDSASFITAQSTFDQNVLTLKAALNLDAAAPFDLDLPAVDKIPIVPLLDLQPEALYQIAYKNQPLQKENNLKILGAQKSIDANKAALYPSLSIGYSLGSSFSNSLKQIDLNSVAVIGEIPTGTYAKVNNVPYDVYEPLYTYNYKSKSFGNWWSGYGNQLDQNFRQALGLTISVPIFNTGNTYRINYEQSKLNLKNLQLQKEQADMTLKQNIYSAYANAVASVKKYYASVKSVESAQKAYDFSRKRYDVGLLGTIDLLTNQNNLLRTKLQLLSDQYDYVFRMKLLEFYKGDGLKL